ncbi:MAG: hypothetical protein PHO46_02295 [Thermoguttaceae bacterium]|nr:hypothetical protein [Thermoguttaceae bacterium]
MDRSVCYESGVWQETRAPFDSAAFFVSVTHKDVFLQKDAQPIYYLAVEASRIIKYFT